MVHDAEMVEGMNQDFKDGYNEAIKFIDFHASFLRLSELSEQKRKRLQQAYYDLIDELRAHLKYNEDVEAATLAELAAEKEDK